jgi:iron-sulfur cluster repair protein YtfE (RIC family)
MSLVRLGARATREPGAPELLLECHARIRTFAALAVRLATAPASESELADAAARVHRYFTEALPLHVADEERSVAPRLRRLAPDTALALDRMEREHRAHDSLLAILIPAWASLRSEPGAKTSLAADAAHLQSLLEEHLAAEERLVIPALARLPADELRALVDEIRARRLRG